MREISAGGVVVEDNCVLLLRKFRGGWVLPKGRLESDESLEEAALREVREESGLLCRIIRSIGFVKYTYRNRKGEQVQKTVHYFYMEEEKGALHPQREEGFCEASYVPWRRALHLLRYESERRMVKTAFSQR